MIYLESRTHKVLWFLSSWSSKAADHTFATFHVQFDLFKKNRTTSYRNFPSIFNLLHISSYWFLFIFLFISILKSRTANTISTDHVVQWYHNSYDPNISTTQSTFDLVQWYSDQPSSTIMIYKYLVNCGDMVLWTDGH